MQNYKPGTDVPITFSLLGESGAVLTPTAMQWRVLDEAEVELQSWAGVGTMPTTSEITITIPGALNVLTPPAVRGIRCIELEITTAAGTVTLTDQVMIQGSTALVFGTNSFQTFGQATLLAEDFTSEQLGGWISAVREDREKAMIQAYQRILLLPLHASYVDGMNQSALASDTVISNISGQLRYMSPAEMRNVNPRLMTALRAAQLVEAVDILSYDPVAQARLNGLQSMTTGESSQFFRTAKPLELGICSKAMTYLQPWVRYNTRIGRA